MKINYRKLVPHGSFIAQYMDAMNESETAYEYDFWGAVWALSSVIGRRVIVDRPNAPIYLNWYIIFVADSGITRKSTAVSHAIKTMKSGVPDDVVHVENMVTPEKLLMDMSVNSEEHGHATTIVSASELVTLFGRQKYTVHLPALFTDFYDCPDHRSGGGIVSRSMPDTRNVYMSLLSASTLAWLVRAINPDIIEGGFTSRCLFITASARKRAIPWPDAAFAGPAERSRESLRRCVESAVNAGHVRLDSTAMDAYAKWYRNRTLSNDSFRQSFESREDAHILRLAAVLCINDESYEISRTHVRQAIKLISHVKDTSSAIFAADVVPDETMLLVDKVRKQLVEAGSGGISHTLLRQRVGQSVPAGKFRQLLDLMHENGMVRAFDVKSSATAKKSSRVWEATDLLSDQEAAVTVLRGMNG